MARRYIDLWLSFFRNSLTREMEYKANFISGIVVDALYYIVHLFFFEIIYRNVSSLGEFSREDVIIFLNEQVIIIVAAICIPIPEYCSQCLLFLSNVIIIQNHNFHHLKHLNQLILYQ